ncbi:phage tail assembly protein [Franconibacter helveticus 513]|uniref:phage tail assembly protein n=1 Tax=Franconibacter helveticus TaxID=357240 RepID=UPI00040EE7D1|nr:phage tail assembly protein [Franconibacter helveticus]
MENVKNEQAPATETTVTLDSPIVRGTTTITEIVVRKPNSGALRGARLQALMDMDVDSMMLVLPRVTTPSLTKAEVAMLEPGDLLQLSLELVSFLLPRSAMSAFPQS